MNKNWQILEKPRYFLLTGALINPVQLQFFCRLCKYFIKILYNRKIVSFLNKSNVFSD